MAENCYLRRDWDGLSPDLLHLIVKKLPDLIDFVHLRAVCKQWRLAICCSSYPQKSPWLLAVTPGTINLFPFSKTISNPCFSYCSKGCIRHRSSETLPYGKDKIECHQISLSTHKEKMNWSEILQYGKDDSLNKMGFQLTVNPLSGNMIGHEFVQPAPVGNLSEIFYSLLSNKKRRVTIKVSKTRLCPYFMGKKFKYDDKSSRINVIDAPTGNVISKIPAPKEYVPHSWLISTRDGLLFVKRSRHLDNSAPCRFGHQFEVYRLENYPKEPYWTMLSGIGDMMLFLDHCNGFSSIASEYDGFKGNCIYFITPLPQSEVLVVARFDMGERRTFPVFSLGESRIWNSIFFWFMPSLV